MLLLSLLLIPILGIFVISISTLYDYLSNWKIKQIKFIALTTSIINLFVSL